MKHSSTLEIRDVRVRFGGLTALDDVSLTVASGQVVGVIGPNGAGKTTLLNVLCGFIRPDEGQVLIEDRAYHNLRPHRLAGLGIARTSGNPGCSSCCPFVPQPQRARGRAAAARRRGGAARGRPGRDTTSWCQTRSSRRWRSYSALGTTRCLCPRVRGGNRAAAHRCAAGRSTPADDVLPGVRPATLQFFVALTLAMAVDDGPGRASARGGRGGHLRMDTRRGIQPTRFHDHERISLHTG